MLLRSIKMYARFLPTLTNDQADNSLLVSFQFCIVYIYNYRLSLFELYLFVTAASKNPNNVHKRWVHILIHV